MPAKLRRTTQEAFAKEEINIIVATVAFGMGIDRSDVRCVIHAAMPQSIEHYQQETGRAGRDGLEAERILFYSPADVLRWQSLFEKNMAEGIGNPQTVRASMDLMEHMRRFCAPGSCRHKILSEYFEQEYPPPKCNACDVCLEETEDLQDGTIEAQMILSCVARVGQRFGMGHVVDVLRGADTQRLKSLGHHNLSTYGLMKDLPKRALNHMIFQLIDQNLLTRTLGDYPVLKLSPESRPVLTGDRNVWLVPSRKKKERVKKTSIEKHSWQGVDRDLYSHLRILRTQLARDRQVPPYVIFSDATLRDMARRMPRTLEAFLDVHGVGEKKQADFGSLFLGHIESYLNNQG
jgi:ATP-dependent DNA helicase RecQ